MTGDGVRLRLLQEIGGSIENFEQYECAAYICLKMKETSLEDWLTRQTHRTMRGDKIAIYALSKLYNRHTMIHTARKTWCTILAVGGNVNYAAACHTHLLFMGNNMYAELHPKLLPHAAMQVPLAIQSVTIIPTATASTSSQPLTSIANKSKLNAAPLVTTSKPPTAETDTEVTVNTFESIPSDKSKQNTVAKDVALTNANGKIIDTNSREIGTVVISTLADKWMDNRSAQVPKSKVTNEPKLTDSSNNSVPLTCTLLNGLPGNTNNNNAEPVTEPTIEPLTSTDLVQKVVIKPPPVTPHHDMQLPTLVSLDEISNDSLLNLDITKSDAVKSHSGIITKECHVVLEPISIDDFKNKQASATSDTKENVTKDDDSGFSENN